MANHPIIVGSAHPLHGELKLGSAHLARCFAEAGYRTLYLNQPTSPMHLAHRLSRPAARARFSAVRGRPTEVPNLSELTPFTFLPHHNSPGLRSDFTLNRWPLFTAPSVFQEIRKSGFASPAAMLFDSVLFWPLAQRLGCKTIYRLADRIDAFPSHSSAMIELHRTVMREADLVVYTSEALAPSRNERQRPSLLLSNGVNFDFFQSPQPPPHEYENIQGPIAVYAGALDRWFDTEALVAAARRFPDVTFVILGPRSDHISKAPLPENVRCLGARPHGALPAYLQHAEIGIIPFNLDTHSHLLDAVCPIKLFEYLACGLNVICYGGSEVARLDAPIVLYDPRPGSGAAHETFASALASAIKAEGSCRQDIEARRSYAKTATWSQRFARLERAMQDTGLIARTASSAAGMA